MAFFIGTFFNGNVKSYFTCQLLLYRQFCKSSQTQGAHTRSYVILDHF